MGRHAQPGLLARRRGWTTPGVPALCLALVAALASASVGIARLDARVATLAPEELATSFVLVASDATVVHVDRPEHRRPVALADLSHSTLGAFVAAEDQRFWQHRGVDPLAIARAAWENLTELAVLQGGSTITQQVVKNLLVGRDRTLARKVHEAALAWRLEQAWSKDEILELYLNYVYLGGGNHGIEAAALDLFGVGAADLDPAQAATLAAQVARPSRTWPRRAPEAARDRRDGVLAAMEASGALGPGEAKRWQDEDLGLVDRSSSVAPAFVTEAQRQLSAALGADRYRHGLRAELTLDRTLQAHAETALVRALADLETRLGTLVPVAELDPDQWRPFLKNAPELRKGADGLPNYPQPGDCFLAVWQERTGFLTADLVFLLAEGEAERPVSDPAGPRPAPFRRMARGAQVYRVCLVEGDRVRLYDGPWAQGAAMVLDHESGRVLALVGGRRDAPGDLVRATRSHRQPGSAFKTFIWAAALQAGQAAVRGEPTSPRDLRHVWWSRRALRSALARSDNHTAAWLARRVGHEAVIATARQMGVRTPIPDHVTLPLGTRELTLQDLVSGYATVARGGTTVSPRLVERVVDWQGQALPLPPPAPSRRVLAPEVAAELDLALTEVVRRGTARPAWRSDRARAGKTGTTDGPSDAWFVGYSGRYTVGVWIGSDRRVPLGPQATGASLALPVWQEIVEELEDRQSP